MSSGSILKAPRLRPTRSSGSLRSSVREEREHAPGRRMSELRDPYEPIATEGNGLGPADVIARAREALAPVRDALERAGFYAYGTVDEENRWVISADDEAGHVDVRVGPDGYLLALWGTVPGLFSE